jgi:ABC-type phosphate/phosphonate transport system substrate-binding protein
MVGDTKFKPIKDILHTNEDSSTDENISVDYAKFLQRLGNGSVKYRTEAAS